MKQEYSIELLEEYEKVNFYSIRMAGEGLTELEAFFEKFPEGCEYDNDIDVIVSWIDQIAERGALERYFRPEGNYGDGIGVIPIDWEINSDCIVCVSRIKFWFLAMEV